MYEHVFSHSLRSAIEHLRAPFNDNKSDVGQSHLRVYMHRVLELRRKIDKTQSQKAGKTLKCTSEKSEFGGQIWGFINGLFDDNQNLSDIQIRFPPVD